MRGIKILSVILTVIISVILAFALIKNHMRDTEFNRGAEQLENMLRPLYTKISDLESDRLALDRSFKSRIDGVATVSLIYTDVSSAVYDTAYPEMSEYGYRGVVALSDRSFPDAEGCMSVAQLSGLLDAGWKWCVTFPADSEAPEADVHTLLERAEAAGFGSTSIIYFPEGSYSDAYDPWLSESGFLTVIHHGENDMAVVVNDSADGIFYQGTVNWRSEYRRYYLDAAVRSYGSLAFDMTIRPDNINADLSYHTSMLKAVGEYCNADKLNVMISDEVNGYRQSVESGKDGASDELQMRLDEINAQIAELRAEIERISREQTETSDG